MVFVPNTPGSILRDTFQEQDKTLAKALQVPSLRFVEKLGTTIIQDVREILFKKRVLVLSRKNTVDEGSGGENDGPGKRRANNNQPS